MILVTFFLLIAGDNAVWGDDMKAVVPKTHDFEAELIEGQSKAPDLFRQTNTDTLSVDSVIYLRENFNDFHSRDSKRRPNFADPPTKGDKK